MTSISEGVEEGSVPILRDTSTVVSTITSPAEWDAFVNSRPEATGYHLSAWRTVFERAFGHRTEYLVARQAKEIVGVLPLVEFHSWLFGRFMVSLPFVNYGGVLAADEAIARALFERAGAIARDRGLSHVELRHLTRRFAEVPCKRHKVAMLLPLGSDRDAMWNALDRKVRNQVRKAEKSDLICQVGGAELIDEFYSIFATNMRDLGTPVYAKRFFAEVLAAFPDRTIIFVVRQGRIAIASGIGFRYRDRFEMPWASSLRVYRALCPNNLLYWSAINHAITERSRIFDFGRSTPGEGTYHFKQQWGAVAEPLCWEYQLLNGSSLPDQSPKNPKFAIAIRLWQRLPVAWTNAIGPPIARSLA